MAQKKIDLKKRFHSPEFIYVYLTLLLLAPLFTLGYIQTFDMPWGPQIPRVDASSNNWLLLFVFNALSRVISSMIVQKLLLIIIFLLAGIGAHKVAQSSKLAAPAAYAAGVFYMINPFVYTRLMAGQWLVLLGYALLPWAVASLWRLMTSPSRRSAIVAAAWTAAIGFTSIHTLGFVLLAAIVFFMVAGKQDLKKRLQWSAVSALGWLIASSIWIVPAYLQKSYDVVQAFGTSQLDAFATTGSVLGSVPLSTLLLHGFWADLQGRYYLPSSLNWWWGIVAGLLGVLIVFGAVIVIRRRDQLGIGLVVLGIIGWWLAMGVGSSWSAGTTNWLVAHVPFYQGYREPQKWLMLLVLAYSYLLAVGTTRLMTYVREHKPGIEPSILYSVMLLPLLLTPMLLWGAGGQLRSSQYPDGWQLVAQSLDADESDYQILVLPWHLYMPVSFTGRVVANPAPHYFKQSLVISDDPELAGVPPTQATPLLRQVDNILLPQANRRSDAAAQLALCKVKYVMLLHEADWRAYDWLDRQTGITKIKSTDSISLYKVEGVQ